MPRGLRHLSHLSHLTQAEFARRSARAELLRHTRWGGATGRRYSMWQRGLVCMLAVLMWLSPLTVTWQQAGDAAGVLGAGAFNLDGLNDAMAISTLPLSVRLGIAQAQAAPITDPNAPISFRPTVTQSTGANGGVPVVNITAPNAAGISLNQYQSFNIDPIGLILNNSTLNGTSLTGGQVAANPNLTTRYASVIINQVTSTGSAFASALNGPLEVFGVPATVIIANPNGIATQGAAFTNTIGVTLTTGVPQFLTQVGGTTTSFDNAQAVGYSGTGGHIQIEGNAGVNGPGAGIDGTVGNLDLIAETIGIDAPLYAGGKINVIAGDQLVTPSSVDTGGGTTYSTGGNGSTNTATAIAAANGGSATYAIDATAYGAMTAGEIQMIGTAAGMGVRLDAQMTANTGNLQISSNGDLSLVGVQASGDVTLNTGGNLTTGTVQSGGSLNASAGLGMTLGTQTLAASNAILSAGQDIQVNGAFATGAALSATTQGNFDLNGTLQSGTDMTLTTAQQIDVAGTLIALGNGTLNAGTNLVGAGPLSVGQNAALSAVDDVTLSGLLTVGSPSIVGSLQINAGSDLTLANAQVGGTIALTAGQDLSLSGTLAGTAVQITAGNSATLTNLQATSTLGIQANGGAGTGDVVFNGAVSALGATTVQAARDIDVNAGGSLLAGDTLALSAQRNLQLNGAVDSAENMTLTASTGALTSSTTLSSGADLNLNAAQGMTLSGQATAVGDTALSSAQDIDLLGTVAGLGNGSLSAGGDINASGSSSFVQNATLSATGNVNLAGALQGNAVQITAGNNATLNDVQADSTLAIQANGVAGQGDITVNGAVLAQGNTTLQAARDTTISGALLTGGTLGATSAGNTLVSGLVQSVGTMTLNNTNGSLTTTGNLNSGSDLNITAGQSINLGTQTTTALGNTTLNATQGITLAGTVVGQGNGTLTAGTTLSGAGSTAFGQNAVLSSGTDTTLTGLLQGNVIQVTAGNDASLYNLQSGSTLAIQANGNQGEGDITLTGTASAAGAANLAAARDVAISGALSGGSTINITAQGNLALIGTLQAASDLTLAAVNGDLTTTGDATTSGNLNASAGQNLSLDALTTVSGNTTLSAGQALTLAGTLVAVGNGTLTAGTDINGAGSAGIGSAAILNAGGNIDLTGSLQSGTLNATAGNNATLANLQTSGTLAVQANGLAGQGDVTLTGTVNAADALTAQAARDVNISGNIAGGTTVALTGQRDVNVMGTVLSASDMTLSAATGSVTASGALGSGTSVTANAGQGVTLGNVQAATTLTAQANGGDLTLNGIASALGAVTLSASGDTTINGTLAGSTVNVTSQGSVSIPGTVQSVGDLNLSALNGSLTTTANTSTGGDLTAGGNLNASAGQTLTLGSLTTVALNTMLNAGQDVTLIGNLAGSGSGQLTAGADINGAGTTAFVQAGLLNAGGNVDLTGSLQAGTLNVTAGSNLTLNNVVTLGTPDSTGVLQSNGMFNATAGQDLTLTGQALANGMATLTSGQDLNVSGAGTLNTAGATNLVAAGDISVSGQVGSAAQLTLQAQGNVTVGGLIESIDDLSVSALTGNLTSTGGINSGGALTAVSGLALNLGGTTSATGAVNLTAGSDMALSGTLIGQTSGLLNATGDITGAGTQAFTQNATLTAGGNLALTGSLQGAAIQVAGGNNAGLGSVEANAGAISVTAQGNAGQGDITLGSAAALDAITLQAARDIGSSGVITAGTTATLTAGRNLLMAGDLSSVGDAVLTATTGQMTGADIASQGNITANAATTLAFTGWIEAGGNATLTSGSDMQVSGGVVGNNNVTLTTNGNLTAGTVAAGLNAAVQSAGNLTISGDLAANGTINALAGANMALGSAISGGALNLQANGTGGTGGDVDVTGVTYSGTTTTIQAARDIAMTGAVNSSTTATLTAGRNLTLGSTLGANDDVQLTAATGALNSANTITTQGNLTTQSGGSTSLNGALVNGNTSVTSGGDITVTGTLAGLGSGTFVAGGNVNGGGTLADVGNVSITAGQTIDPPTIQTAGAFSASAGGDLEFGAITAVGNVTLQSTQGSLTLDGLVTTGGTLQASAAQNLSALGGVAATDAVTLTALNGNLSAANVASNADVSLQAGQTLTLSGINQIAGNTTLAATAMILSGTLTGEGGFTATASNGTTGSFDASAAQLNITDNAQISGYNVSTGGLLIGGNLTETAANQVTLSGSADVAGTALIGNGTTVQNNGSVLVGQNLTVNATNVNLASGASLTSTSNTALTATILNNQGTIDGLTTAVAVAGGLTNGGSILGVDSLSVSAGSLNNTNGLLFAGDLSSQTADTANLALTVTGGTGSLANTGGQILAQGNLTLNLPNMAVDPSAAVMGTLGAGNVLTLNAASVGLAGNWSPEANTVTINATNGFSNAGTLSVSGALNISTNGLLSNSGTLAAGGVATLYGAIANAANAVIYSGTTLNLGGYVVNAGTIESAGDLNFSGSSYDNQGASTLAQGNMSLQVAGDLQNTGGTIEASNNLTIAANTIENNQTAPTGYTSTTTAVTNAAYLWSLPVGTESWVYTDADYAGDGESDSGTATASIMLGDLLSPTGSQNGAAVSNYMPYTCRTGCGLAASAPVAGSGSISFAEVTADIGTNTQTGDTIYGNVWEIDTGSIAGVLGVDTLALPTVYQTTTTEQAGTAGVISAGGNLQLTANSLSNLGGEIGASGNLTLNVQALSNGAVAPTMTSSTSYSVDQSQFSAFLSQLSAMGSIAAPILVYGCGYSDDDQYGCGTQSQGFVYLDVLPQGAPSITSTTTMSSPTGLIMSAGNMTIAGGNLTNAGTIYAGQNLTLAVSSLTNQGAYTSEMSTQNGCAAGVSAYQCDQIFSNTPRGENPTSSTFSYQQDNATIAAGNDLVIAAGNIINTYGNLIAGNNLYIGGVGTTASSTTPATSLTNTSGNIVAGNNITLNVSGALTNTLPPPALVHEDYGSEVAYSGCMTAGGYKESYCEAYVEQQSANSSNISAGNGLTINAGSLTNIGSLISAGQSATINVAGPIVNSEQTLNAYWHSEWVQETGLFSSDQRNNVWACGSAAECTAIYGSAYTSVGGTIDPPTPVGNIAATIQAPNLSVTSGGQIQNVGNILGSQVTLTGTRLVNGITTNIYTPQVSAPPQVISLAPTGSWGMSQALPNTSSGATQSSNGISYVVNTVGITPADEIGPANLLAALPANLQPSTTLFYYNPQEEDLVLQQAALTETGEASFVNCPTCSTQNGVSVADQDKALLYDNAIAYATANNLQLGTALTQTQINQLTQPMLWYVQQTVPDPSCTATGGATCPTVTALMPQVYLPPNYNAETAGGNISGTNVSLNFSNSILNTGSITASNTLTVNTPTLTNQQNSTNVGQIWSYIQDTGYEDTTGTVAQPGGFMSAANMNLNVQTVNQIGGALQALNSDGTVNAAASQALLSSLQAQLGSNFTQSTVSNNLNTSFTKEGGDFSAEDLAALVVVAALTIATAGAASAAIGGTLGAGGGTFAAGSVATAATATTAGTAAVSAGLGNIALSAAIGGMVGSTVSQLATTGSISFDSVLESGLVAGVTAGLTNGITFNSQTDSLGFTTAPLTVGGPIQSLAGLAGVQSVGNTLVPNATAATGSIPEEVLAVGADATITAGVQTAIGGGSLLDNLKTAGVQDAAADLADTIGNTFGAGGTDPNLALSIASHAVLGCAASAAEGTGCAGGAIGGATSAAFAPDVIAAIDPTGAPLNTAQTALVTALSMLGGSVTAGLAGANAQAGATWAENEAMNNSEQATHVAGEASDGGFFTAIKNGATAATTYVTAALNSVVNPSPSTSNPDAIQPVYPLESLLLGGNALYRAASTAYNFYTGVTGSTSTSTSSGTTYVFDGGDTDTATSGGPYSNLIDSPSVGPGKNFTQTQKANIYQQNMLNNNGALLSDLDGEELVMPSQSQAGVTPPSNEAQIDHIVPKNPADPNVAPGTNSYSNAQVLSRLQNAQKSNK